MDSESKKSLDITVLVLKLANWGTVWQHARALTRDVGCVL